jgi:hypothetical protein
MDFMAGGELFHYMHNELRFKEDRVAFYVA